MWTKHTNIADQGYLIWTLPCPGSVVEGVVGRMIGDSKVPDWVGRRQTVIASRHLVGAGTRWKDGGEWAELTAGPLVRRKRCGD